MDDLAIRFDNRPGALAEPAETLGAAGISIESGGVFVVDGVADAGVNIDALYSDHRGRLSRSSTRIRLARVSIWTGFVRVGDENTRPRGFRR